MLFPIISALLGIAALSPLNTYLLGFIFLVPLFIFYAREEKFVRLLWGTLLFRIVFMLGTVYYTLEPINWLWAICIFSGLPITIYLYKKYSSTTNQGFIIPLLWVLFDHLQAQYALVPTYIITSGNILGMSPFVGLARPFGIITLTIFVAIINGLLAYAYWAKKSVRKPALVAVAMMLACTLAYAKQTPATSQTANKQLTIAAIATSKNFTLVDLYALERQLGKTKVDLIVLPENMIEEPTIGNPLHWYQEMAKTLNTPILATVHLKENDKGTITTLIISANGTVQDRHDKARLTFMGEYWPFARWRPRFIEWLAHYDPMIQSYAVFDPTIRYTEGARNVLTVQTAQGSIRIAALICMEIQYPYDLMTYKRNGIDLIITPTSNRWLSQGTKQFRYLTNNLRTIESVTTGTPLALAGVNDDAGIIYPDGATQKTAPESEAVPYVISIANLSY